MQVRNELFLVFFFFNFLIILNIVFLILGKTDVREADNNVDCTFLRNLTYFSEPTDTSQSLENLLIEFFKFYAVFDFVNYAISIFEADRLKKPDFSPLYICNPLELGLNVSRNVSLKEANQFTALCASSAEILTKNDSLINIFDPKTVASKSKHIFNVNIQNIFDEAKYDNQKAQATEKQKVSDKFRGT